MDTEDEEHEVRRLTKEELEIYHQYKEFYTIQTRTKGKMASFGYIHRLKVKEHYPGIPTDLVKTFSHPYRRRSPGYKSTTRTRDY